MAKSGRILPKEVIAHWPEVFGDIKLNVMPVRYLHSVLVNFKDGKTWEIKLSAQAKRAGWESFQKSLSDLCSSYENKIDNIDFKLDTHLIKKHVQESTNKFLKKKKL